jgi:hypothetical protein
MAEGSIRRRAVGPARPAAANQAIAGPELVSLWLDRPGLGCGGRTCLVLRRGRRLARRLGLPVGRRDTKAALAALCGHSAVGPRRGSNR